MRKSLYDLCLEVTSVGDESLPLLKLHPDGKFKIRVLGAAYHYYLHVGQAIFRVGDPVRCSWKKDERGYIPTQTSSPDNRINLPPVHNGMKGLYEVFDAWEDRDVPEFPVLDRYRMIVMDLEDGNRCKQIDCGLDLYYEFCEFWEAFGRLPGGEDGSPFILKTDVSNGYVWTNAYCIDKHPVHELTFAIVPSLTESMLKEIAPHSQLEISTLLVAANKYGRYDPKSMNIGPYMVNKAVKLTDIDAQADMRAFGAFPIRQQDIPVLTKEQAAEEWAKIQKVKASLSEQEVEAMYGSMYLPEPSSLSSSARGETSRPHPSSATTSTRPSRWPHGATRPSSQPRSQLGRWMRS